MQPRRADSVDPRAAGASVSVKKSGLRQISKGIVIDCTSSLPVGLRFDTNRSGALAPAVYKYRVSRGIWSAVHTFDVIPRHTIGQVRLLGDGEEKVDARG